MLLGTGVYLQKLMLNPSLIDPNLLEVAQFYLRCTLNKQPQIHSRLIKKQKAKGEL